MGNYQECLSRTSLHPPHRHLQHHKSNVSDNVDQHNYADLSDIRLPEIDKWKGTRSDVSAYIAKNIHLRFYSRKVSLCYFYHDHDNKRRQKCGVTPLQIIEHINTLPWGERKQYAETFSTTMALSHVLKSFRRRDDIAANQEWKHSLDLYLKTLQNIMYHAMNNGSLKALSDFKADPEKNAHKARLASADAHTKQLEARLANAVAHTKQLKTRLAMAESEAETSNVLLAKAQADKRSVMAMAQADKQS